MIAKIKLSELEQKSHELDKYHYTDIEDDKRYIGLFVPKQYAKEAKAFVEKCKKREDEIR